MSWNQRRDTLPTRIVLETGNDSAAVVEILEWNYRDRLTDNAPHRHTYFEIRLMGAHGAGEFRVEGSAHPIRPGDVFFARPGVIHQIVNTSEPPMELFWVGFRPEKISGAGILGKRFESLRHSEVLVRRGELVAHLWQSLRSVCETRDALWELQARELSTVLLRGLITLGSETVMPARTVSESGLHESAAAHRRASATAALRC